MSDTKQISVHTSRGWETVQVNAPANKHSTEFASTGPIPDELLWQPVAGLGLFDYTHTKGYYRSFAYACINKKALNVSKANIYLYRQYKSKKTEIKDHSFLKLINSQNSYGQSFKTILFLASANCDINGWAYVQVVTVQTPFIALGNAGKTPVELIPLPAKNVTPVYNSQNTAIEYYRYGTVKLMPDEVIAFKVPNPDSNLTAFAPVKAFNFTMDIDYLSARSRRSFFDNDARPTLAVSFPTPLQPTTFNRYVTEFNRKQAGSSNNGKAIVTDNGATVNALNTTGRELDYVNSRTQILDEMMLILDLNAQVMGVFKDSNYNNSKNALRGWMENTVIPYADMVFNEPLTAFVKLYYDVKLVTSMEYDLEYDRETQLQSLEYYTDKLKVKRSVIAEMEGFSEEDLENTEPLPANKTEQTT